MGQILSCCFSAKEATRQELMQPENTPSKEEKSDCKTKGRQQIKIVEATNSEVQIEYDSGYDYDSDSELLPHKAQIKEFEATSQELAQPENTPSKEEKSDFKKGQQQIKEVKPTLEEDSKKTPSKKGNSACDRALQKLRQKQAKDLESPSKIKTPRPIGPDLCELRLTKLSNNYIMYDIDYRSHLFDLI